jgi:hypothetical protein
VLSKLPDGQCRITQDEASLSLPTDCASLTPRATTLPYAALDWVQPGQTDLLLLARHGQRLRIVLRRPARSESLPVEESGDTIISTATWRADTVVNGWPVLVETRVSTAQQFNRVDRKAADVETEEIRFVYLLGAYRAVPSAE